MGSVRRLHCIHNKDTSLANKTVALPELINPDVKWNVYESNAPISTVRITESSGDSRGLYQIPKILVPDDILQRARANIMADQDWARMDGYGLHDGLVELAMHHYGDSIGLPVKHAWDSYDWANTPEPDSVIGQASRSLQLLEAIHSASSETPISKHFHNNWQKLPSRTRSAIREAYDAIRLAVERRRLDKISGLIEQYAREIGDTILQDTTPPPPPPSPEREQREEDIERQIQEDEDFLKPPPERKSRKDPKDDIPKGPTGIHKVVNIEMKITIHRHLDTQHNVKTVGMTWRPHHFGPKLRQPGRLYRDGKILSKHSPGGSIIFDGSGSMNWDYDKLKALSDKVPNLWAGIYTATPDIHVSRLCIFAESGRVGRYTHHGDYYAEQGNMDGLGPLLMTKMGPPPYVFVTDRGFFYYTAKGSAAPYDRSTQGQKFGQELDKIFKDNKIVIVPDIDSAIKYLDGKVVQGWTDCIGPATYIRKK